MTDGLSIMHTPFTKLNCVLNYRGAVMESLSETVDGKKVFSDSFISENER